MPPTPLFSHGALSDSMCFATGLGHWGFLDPQGLGFRTWFTSWEMIPPALKNVKKILPKSSQNSVKIPQKTIQNPPPGRLWGVLGGAGGPLGHHLAAGRPSLPGSYWILSVSGLRWAPQMGTKTPQSRYSSKLGAQNKGFWGGSGPPNACLFGHMRNSVFDQ